MDRIDFRSADNTPLVAWRWPARGEVKGRVLLLHGVGEHIRRYDYAAGRLSSAGYTVVGLNLRGHGESGGKRGHLHHWKDYLEDVDAAARVTGGDFHLLGHSMGTLVALDWLRKNPISVQSVILSAPLLGIAFPIPWWKKMGAELLSKILPALPMENELDSAEICSDKDVVAKYLQDPNCFHTVTPRLYTEMMQSIENVHAENSQTWRWPLQIHAGRFDGLISFGDIDRFYAAWPGRKEYVVWPEGRHESMNEPFRDQVLDSMISFLNSSK